MRYSFLVFRNFRDVPKVTVFGSARTQPDQPNYQLAADFASQMTDDRGWMVVTGAGPGIMEAANLGAGADDSFGVNIRLPFEAEANPYIHESRLINFKYFFTRKLMFMKESNAFALFPGGFGTMDETYESKPARVLSARSCWSKRPAPPTGTGGSTLSPARSWNRE